MVSKGIDIFMFIPSVPLDKTPNGVCTYAKNLICLLSDDGSFRVRLVAKASTQEDCAAAGAHAYYLNQNSMARRLLVRIFGRPKYEAMMAWKFGKFVQKASRQSPCLIEMEEVFGQSKRVQRYAGAVPVVVRLHGPWFLVGDAQGFPHDLNYQERVRAEGEAIYAADAVSAPSEFVLRAVEEFYKKELPRKIVIANPFPECFPEDHWKLPEATSLVLFVGRFDKVKGADIFIEAMFKLAEKVDGLRAVFVGPDDKKIAVEDGRVLDRQAFVAWCEEKYQRPSPIEFMGRKSPEEITQLRKQAAVCVVSSRIEMFPYTVAEALAQGVPTVASQVGGIPEMIDDGHNGLLFDSEDVDGLLACARKILASPELSVQLSANALTTVREKYSHEVLARAQKKFYRSVADCFVDG
ncbi:glycosyltransferase family 4 protein [Comamonas faecalis]